MSRRSAQSPATVGIQKWALKSDPLTALTIVVFTASLVFGGASRLNGLAVAGLELLALPLLVLAISRSTRLFTEPNHKWLLTILALIVAIPIVQLVQLPPSLWTRLPGREQLVLALQVTGLPAGWSPISVAPDRTLANALALIPPVAILLAILTRPEPLGRLLIQVFYAIAAVSIVIGAAQLASGSTRFYPWPTTDAGNVVGFFANRNHFATLLVMILPFAAAVAAQASKRREGHAGQWLAVGFFALTTIALAGVGSRAGFLLLGPSLALSIAIWLPQVAPRLSRVQIGAIAVGGLFLLVVAAFAFGPVLARFEGVDGPGSRLDNWSTVVQAIPTYLPVGAGIGSFDVVYRAVEPLSRLDPTYFNQAHNDWLEILIESGLFGAGALIAFVCWWAVRTLKVWRSDSPSALLGRGASAALLLLLLHSAVDYPIRTLAIAVVTAMSVAVLEFAAVRPRIVRD